MRFHTLRRLLLLSLLLLCLCAQAFGQSVTITGPATVSPGATVQLTATITNTLSPRPPIILTAGATYTDSLGNPYTSTATPLMLTVTQPETFSALTMTLPSSLSYVVGSAQSTVPVTGTVTSGVLTLTLGGGGAVLTEGQSVSILFKVTAGK
jgi:hypothetical protein